MKRKTQPRQQEKQTPKAQEKQTQELKGPARGGRITLGLPGWAPSLWRDEVPKLYQFLRNGGASAADAQREVAMQFPGARVVEAAAPQTAQAEKQKPARTPTAQTEEVAERGKAVPVSDGKKQRGRYLSWGREKKDFHRFLAERGPKGSVGRFVKTLKAKGYEYNREQLAKLRATLDKVRQAYEREHPESGA